MSGDLLALGTKEEWYQLCQDRKEWAVQCRKGVNEVASCRKKNTCAANRQSQEKTFVCVCVEEALGDKGTSLDTRNSVEAKHYQPRLMPRASLSRLFKPWAVSRFQGGGGGGRGGIRPFPLSTIS